MATPGLAMPELPRRQAAYRPIGDYGIIGNPASVALVARDGGIDWCCLPRMDSPSVFAALLDARRGGSFAVRPARVPRRTLQRYEPRTNVLVTIFEVEGGRVELRDFMPVGGTLEEGSDESPEPVIYRRIRCLDGDVEVAVEWTPRLDYGRATTRIDGEEGGFRARAEGGFRARAEGGLRARAEGGLRARAEGGSPANSGAAGPGPGLALSGLPEGRVSDTGLGPGVQARLEMRSGDERFLRTAWGEERPRAVDPGEAGRALRETEEAWRRWVDRPEVGGGRPWLGSWEEPVIRSELVLKLMAQPDSGALAAAPTTSLPETLGGVRNWDYRYAWIRDAAQIAQAFFAVGHPELADRFIQWAESVTSRPEERPDDPLRILHPLRPGTGAEEIVLSHLEGYRRSRPVRVGNAAADQLQIDVYGEVLNLVFERVRLGRGFTPEVDPFLGRVADEACRHWRRPDFGIWEMKNGPFHQVYSKVMAWVALDRALWLRKRGHLEAAPEAAERWRAHRDAARDEVLERGYNEGLGAFVQGYGGEALDAANLLMPVMEFLPAEDPRFQGTLDRTLERLTVADLVYRYRAGDGLPGEEGAFVLCTWWLVDALALSGRLDEAHRVFDALMDRGNHLGLLPEQIDPHSGEFLGNFPQAYSHLGMINSTLYLAAREGRELPVAPLLGLRDEHRAE